MSLGVVEELCQPEVQHLCVAPRRNHYVLWLDVAMNDAVAMGFGQCIRDLYRDIQRLPEVARLSLDASRQSFSFNVLHDDVVQVVLPANLIDRAYIRMVERRGGLGFANKAPRRSFVFSGFRTQKLNSDSAFEPGVLSQVNLAHTTGAERLNDSVMPNHPPSQQSHMTLSHGRCRGFKWRRLDEAAR